MHQKANCWMENHSFEQSTFQQSSNRLEALGLSAAVAAAFAAFASIAASAAAITAAASAVTTAATITAASAVATAAAISTAAAIAATTASAAAAATIAATTTASILTRSSLVYGQLSGAHFRVVLVRDCGFHLVGVDVDKTETSALDNSSFARLISREVVHEIFLTGRVGKVPHVERFRCHSCPLLASGREHLFS
jgi:hypothetical protein